MSDKKKKETISISEVKKSGKKRTLISNKVIFGLILSVLLYLTALIVSNLYNDSLSGDEENGYFHEGLGMTILILIGFFSYVKLFNVNLFVNKKKIDEAADSAKKRKAELKERYKNGYLLLTKSKETGSIIDGLHRLIDVAIELPEERQAVLNHLTTTNQWMSNEKSFLSKANLITWRLKGQLFDTIDSDLQRISLEALTGIEKIIKQHSIDFKEGRTQDMLDLSSKYAPALNLGFIELLPGSLVLDFAFLWQTSFWQGQIMDISFVSTELQGANFWRCYLEQTDFGGANLRNTKLKTNLKEIRNLSPAQFFSTQDWQINILNTEQLTKFFPNQDDKNIAWDKWNGAEEERIMLESTINTPE